jgi:proline dehydrogenase
MPNRLLLAAAELPFIRRLIVANSLTRSVVERFVAGETMEDGIRAARALADAGTLAILDYLGEMVTSEAQADAATGVYLGVLDQVRSGGLDVHVGVKLSQLGLDLSEEATLRRAGRIAEAAEAAGSVLALDMESHDYTDRTIDTYRALRAGHDNVVLCVQAYLRRTEADVRALLPLEPSLRICKGAYREPKEMAYDRDETRRSFVSLLATTLGECPYVAVASHDEGVVDEALAIVAERSIPLDRFEFQMLYGVRRELQLRLASQGYRVRAYVPFGDQWYPYLMRRLAERPSNLRLFVEALVRG